MSRESATSSVVEEENAAEDHEVADDHIQEMADAVKPAAEQRIGHEYDEWEAVHYTTKEANGTLYFIYVSAGKEGGVLLTVFKDGKSGPVRLESAVESGIPGGPCLGAANACCLL
mmetsp:Transcript_73422/g.174958  ORF Transcript_73422/g.174958 Transcript_73422/m.174958 type:complete len:115 (-) Transcript_73422:64-408(-)